MVVFSSGDGDGDGGAQPRELLWPEIIPGSLTTCTTPPQVQLRLIVTVWRQVARCQEQREASTWTRCYGRKLLLLSVQLKLEEPEEVEEETRRSTTHADDRFASRLDSGDSQQAPSSRNSLRGGQKETDTTNIDCGGE